MRLPRFRLRTLMILVGLSAILMVGAADVLNYARMRDRVEVINERKGPDGSAIFELRYGFGRSYSLGPIPIGPCPVAVLSGDIFAVSITMWMLRRWRANRRP